MSRQGLSDQLHTVLRSLSESEIAQIGGGHLRELGIRLPGEWWGTHHQLGLALYQELCPPVSTPVLTEEDPEEGPKRFMPMISPWYLAMAQEIAECSFIHPAEILRSLIACAAVSLLAMKAGGVTTSPEST